MPRCGSLSSAHPTPSGDVGCSEGNPRLLVTEKILHQEEEGSGGTARESCPYFLWAWRLMERTEGW